MDERVAHGAEARAEIARELLGSQLRAGIERAMVRPRVVIVQRAKIFGIHAYKLLSDWVFMRCGYPIRSGTLACRQVLVEFAGRMVRFRVRWKLAAAHVGAKVRDGSRNFRGEIRVSPDEFRRMSGSESYEVVEHEHLSIAIGAGADTDRGNAKRFRDACCNFARHGFEHYRKGTRGFHGSRVPLDLPGGVFCFSLHMKSAECVHRLRRQPSSRTIPD